MKIVDRDWDRFEKLASRGIREPLKEPLPPPYILDFMSWAVVITFFVGLIKKI